MQEEPSHGEVNLQIKVARWTWDEAKLVDAKNKFSLIPELLLSTCYVLNPRRGEERKKRDTEMSYAITQYPQR